MTKQEENLAIFIKVLENSGILKFHVLDSDEESNFDTRLKIQKYVYLAKYYGLDMRYPYSMYLYGPYSSQLADDYYSVEPFYSQYFGMNHDNLPSSFRKSEFIDLVRGKDSNWLEVAATLLSLNKSFKDKKSLLDRTANMKDHIPKEMIESILMELENKKLITF
jgi:uncharacterized protein YwgA